MRPFSCFTDRTQAGRRLARRLLGLNLEAPVILALPRGGVPVAAQIARMLHAPLDLVLVRKIGVPSQGELAAAAVVDGDRPEIVVNADVLALTGLTRADVDAQAKVQLAEIERRRALYLAGRPRVPLAGRALVVVDDGIATGATVRAALTALRRQEPKRLILAVPLAPREVLAELRPLVDDLVCLRSPEPFWAVGMHYHDFDQVTDREVTDLLDAAAKDDAAGRETPAVTVGSGAVGNRPTAAGAAGTWR